MMPLLSFSPFYPPAGTPSTLDNEGLGPKADSTNPGSTTSAGGEQLFVSLTTTAAQMHKGMGWGVVFLVRASFASQLL